MIVQNFKKPTCATTKAMKYKKPLKVLYNGRSVLKFQPVGLGCFLPSDEYGPYRRLKICSCNDNFKLFASPIISFPLKLKKLNAHLEIY